MVVGIVDVHVVLDLGVLLVLLVTGFYFAYHVVEVIADFEVLGFELLVGECLRCVFLILSCLLNQIKQPPRIDKIPWTILWSLRPKLIKVSFMLTLPLFILLIKICVNILTDLILI